MGRLGTFLDALVDERQVSAAVARVADDDEVIAEVTAGRHGPRPVQPSDLFDLASLTKPFVATLALVLDRSGELPLATPLGRVFETAAPQLARRHLSSLLRHRAGLIAWTPLYARAKTPAEAVELLFSGSCSGAPPGTYSDLGYILWARAATTAVGRPLFELLQSRVLDPLEIGDVTLRPAPGTALRSPLDNRKEVELAARQDLTVGPRPPVHRGRAQDGNARFLGGLPGHAGLFGTAAAVHRLATEWLRPGKLLDPPAVRRSLSGSGSYAMGWARRRVRGSSGPALSPESFGHLGFTGSSVWVDPERQRIAVLAAHRLPEVDMTPHRRRFHEMAMESDGSNYGS